jgi:hypothetical protein
MSAIIFAESRPQFYRNLVESVLCLPLLFLSRRAIRDFSSLTRETRKQYESNDFFLLWIFISQLLQFVDAFLFSFSFMEYIVWFILGLVLYALSNLLLNCLKSTAPWSGVLSAGLKLILFADAALLIWSLLSIRSANNCGQIHVHFYTAFFFATGAYLGCLAVWNFRQTKGVSDELSRELIDKNQDSFDQRDLTAQQKYAFKTMQFFQGVLVVTLLNCFGYALFLLWKFPGDDFSCSLLFTKLPGLVLVALSVLEFSLRNAALFFLFYVYYWKVRAMVKSEVQLSRVNSLSADNRIVEEED